MLGSLLYNDLYPSPSFSPTSSDRLCLRGDIISGDNADDDVVGRSLGERWFMSSRLLFLFVKGEEKPVIRESSMVVSDDEDVVPCR